MGFAAAFVAEGEVGASMMFFTGSALFVKGGANGKGSREERCWCNAAVTADYARAKTGQDSYSTPRSPPRPGRYSYRHIARKTNIHEPLARYRAHTESEMRKLHRSRTQGSSLPREIHGNSMEILNI